MIITAKEASSVTSRRAMDKRKPVGKNTNKDNYAAPYNNYNNSIIIDCNSLVSDTDKEHLLRVNRTDKKHNASITPNIGKSPSPFEQSRE